MGCHIFLWKVSFFSLCWKTTQVQHFECQKGHFLRHLRGLPLFPIFNFSHFECQFFVRFGTYKTFSRVIFSVFDEKLIQKRITPHKLKKIVWPSLTLWSWMTLIWHKVINGLEGYLKASQIRFISLNWLYCNLMFLSDALLCPPLVSDTVPDKGGRWGKVDRRGKVDHPPSCFYE